MPPQAPDPRRPTAVAAVRWLAVAAVALVCLGALLLTVPLPAGAERSDLAAALAKYPHIAGTRLDDCALCHNSPRYSLDAYGRAFSRARRDFGAIEAEDSDGDGYGNLAEILALTFPGKADSVPTGTVTVTVAATGSPTPTPAPTGSPTPTPPPTESATAAPTRPATWTPTHGATVSPTNTPVPHRTPAEQVDVYLPLAERRTS